MLWGFFFWSLRRFTSSYPISNILIIGSLNHRTDLQQNPARMRYYSWNNLLRKLCTCNYKFERHFHYNNKIWCPRIKTRARYEFQKIWQSTANIYLKAARYLDYSIRLFENRNLNRVLYQTLHVIHRKYIDWFHLESKSKTKIHDPYQ